MLHLEGERVLSMPPERLWPKLRDASFLVRCIPDATVTNPPTRDRAECQVRTGFTFVRGVLEVILEIRDATEPTLVRYRQISKGIGTSSEVETTVELLSHEQGTQIKWRAEVSKLGGLLKAVPSGLIRGAAQKVIEDLWRGIEKLALDTGETAKNSVR